MFIIYFRNSQRYHCLKLKMYWPCLLWKMQTFLIQYRDNYILRNSIRIFFMRYTYLYKQKNQTQGSRWRAIRSKKSTCEGWLCFLVGQMRSSSRPGLCRVAARIFFHLSFMKMLISCLLKSIISVKYFERDFLGK